MRDVLGKMWECGKYIKMRDFPHDCGMVDTYAHLVLYVCNTPSLILYSRLSKYVLCWIGNL